MTRRATHLFHPENIGEEQSKTSEKNSQEHQRTVKNIREEQSRASKKNSQEHQRRTVKNAVKLSRVETKRSRNKKSIFIRKVILQKLKTKNK